MKAMRCIICAAIATVVSYGQIVSKADWDQNAQTIIGLREQNRSEQKFVEQFMLHNASLFLAYSEISEKRSNRPTEARLAVIMYLDAKLLVQYVRDHPEDLKGQMEPAQGALQVFTDIFRQYKIPLTDAELNNFRLSFAKEPKLRLRSL